MPITFISYRREDSTGYAGRLHEELEQRLGDGEVFRDVDTLRPGQDFVEGIRQRLENCGTFVALIGRTWLHASDDAGGRRIDRPDDYVLMEIGEALARPDVLLVPVLVGGATMPTAHQLPESIRALARRQALVLRDDTWEQDVDRLANTLLAHGGRRRPPLAGPRARRSGLPRWAVGALALLVVVATIGFVSFRGPSGTSEPAAPVGTDDVPPAAPPATPPAEPASTGATAGRAYAIDILGNPEVAHGEAIYTVLTGSVVDHGTSRTLWVRLRASNEGRRAMALWSDTFQLISNGQTLPSTTTFSETLPAFSLTQKLVSFELPTLPPRVELRVLAGSEVGSVALDLRPSGRPPVHDQPDTGDALSRASLATLIPTPTPLPANGELAATLLRVTSRRFANLRRLTATIRYQNQGRYDQGTWGVVLHVVDGDDVLAPRTQPSAAVAGLATFTGDSVFEVRPTAASVQLRVTSGTANLLIPLKLP